MQFISEGVFYKAARVTGPAHNFLSLQLVDGLETSAPAVQILGGDGSPRLDGVAVLKAVMEGVEEANLRFAVRYGVAVLQYVEQDSPPESTYAYLAFSIVERLVAGLPFAAA